MWFSPTKTQIEIRMDGNQPIIRKRGRKKSTVLLLLSAHTIRITSASSKQQQQTKLHEENTKNTRSTRHSKWHFVSYFLSSLHSNDCMVVTGTIAPSRDIPDLTAEETIRIILSNMNLVVPVVCAVAVIIIAIVVICILRSKSNHHKGIFKANNTNPQFVFSFSLFLSFLFYFSCVFCFIVCFVGS